MLLQWVRHTCATRFTVISSYSSQWLDSFGDNVMDFFFTFVSLFKKKTEAKNKTNRYIYWDTKNIRLHWHFVRKHVVCHSVYCYCNESLAQKWLRAPNRFKITVHNNPFLVEPVNRTADNIERSTTTGQQ